MSVSTVSWHYFAIISRTCALRVCPTADSGVVNKPAAAGAVQVHDCIEYAVIADVASPGTSDDGMTASQGSSNTSLCGGISGMFGGRRDEVVFRSRGHVIQIYVRQQQKSFLLSYEGDVLIVAILNRRRTNRSLAYLS